MCLSCRKKGRLRRPLLKKDALLGIVDPGGDSLEIPRDSLRLLASVPQIRLTLDDTEERLVYDHLSPEDDIVLTSVQKSRAASKVSTPLGFRIHVLSGGRAEGAISRKPKMYWIRPKGDYLFERIVQIHTLRKGNVLFFMFCLYMAGREPSVYCQAQAFRMRLFGSVKIAKY